MIQLPLILSKALLHRFSLMIRIFLFIVLFFSIQNAYAQPASAQVPSSQIEISAEPFFEGHFKYGEWLPISVEISNPGSDIKAELRTAVQTSGGSVDYSLDLDLPSGAKKRLTLYALPNNFSRQLDIVLVAGQELLASQRIQVNPNPTVNLLVGIIAPERGAISLVQSIKTTGMSRPKFLIDIPLSELPERSEGLRSFDVLVLNDLDTSQMTSDQSSALETWVQGGGILLIGGGPNAELTSAGLPSTLFPGEITETLEINSLSALEKFASSEKPVLIPGPFIAARLTTSSGRLIAGVDSLPFIYEWTYGTGTVIFSALDLAVTPFNFLGWDFRFLGYPARKSDYLPNLDASRHCARASSSPAACPMSSKTCPC